MSGRRDRGVDYLRLGQGLLLLGALVGFMYWRSTAECEDGRVQLLMFLKVAAFLLELLILVSVCISLAQMTSTQDEADELNPFDVHEINDNSTISWVLALSWVFVVCGGAGVAGVPRYQSEFYSPTTYHPYNSAVVCTRPRAPSIFGAGADHSSTR